MLERETSEDEIGLGWTVQGLQTDQIAELSVQLGWSSADTIKLLKKQYDLGIGDAKQLVDRFVDHPRRRATTYLQLQAELAGRLPDWATEEDMLELEGETGWNRKLWALVEAGRHREIGGAMKRFHPEHLRFRLLEFEAAKRLVEISIETWPMPMRIIDGATRQHSFGWTFSCQSSAYLASGDMLDMAVGHGPFLVDSLTGVLWSTGSAVQLDHYVANYLKSGTPYGLRG